MASVTVENYLKQIFLLSVENESDPVSMGRIAKYMGVVPGTATTMVKSMEKINLLRYKPRTGVWLTTEGRELAVKVLRKHRIVEMFLVQVLNIDWAEIHEEAELLEHAISDKLVKRMDEFLGFPEVDPHGDPIPSASGKMKKQQLVSLNKAKVGVELEVSRITRQDPEFLNYINRSNLTPGTRMQIKRKDSVADVLEIELENKQDKLTIGGSPSANILVTQEF